MSPSDWLILKVSPAPVLTVKYPPLLVYPNAVAALAGGAKVDSPTAKAKEAAARPPAPARNWRRPSARDPCLNMFQRNKPADPRSRPPPRTADTSQGRNRTVVERPRKFQYSHKIHKIEHGRDARSSGLRCRHCPFLRRRMAAPTRGSLRTTASAMLASSHPARAVLRRPGPDSTSPPTTGPAAAPRLYAEENPADAMSEPRGATTRTRACIETKTPATPKLSAACKTAA